MTLNRCICTDEYEHPECTSPDCIWAENDFMLLIDHIKRTVPDCKILMTNCSECFGLFRVNIADVDDHIIECHHCGKVANA